MHARFLHFFFCAACDSMATTPADADVADASRNDVVDCPERADYMTPRPWLLRAEGGTIYWSSAGSGVYGNDGTVGKIDSCGRKTLLSTYQAAPYGLAVGESTVCWVNLGSTINGAYANDGSIGCTGPAGLRWISEPTPRPNGPAVVHAGEIFWSRDNAIAAAPVAGGQSRSVLASNSDGKIGPLVVLGGIVYFGGLTKIRGVSATGGTAFDVTTAVARDLATDGESLFFAGFFGSQRGIFRLSASVTSQPILLTLADPGNEIGVDATDVYFLDDAIDGTSTWSVMKVPKTGGSASFVAMGADGYAVTVDERYVYVGGGGISRIPK